MPNTIEQNLQRLVNAKSAISEAITAKGGTVSTGDGFEDFPADIASIPSGGGGGSGDASKPVRFMDYDGSIVASYTPEEFAELTEMPANPAHDGLIALGWNWSLSDAKECVSNYGTLNVGQMYITDDGRTRLYIRIQEGRRSPVLQLYLDANSQLDIDWGDVSSHSTFTTTSADYKSKLHIYAPAGDYIISIGVTSGSFSLESSVSLSTLFTDNTSTYTSNVRYLNTIRKIEIGDNITSIGTYAFSSCYSLSQVTIPSSVTSIGARAFYACYSLGFIKFVRQTPPTVSNSSVWGNVPTDCKILVPRGTLSAYKSATNYPSSSTYTYKEYDI